MRYLLLSNIEITDESQFIIGVALVVLMFGAAMVGMLGGE